MDGKIVETYEYDAFGNTVIRNKFGVQLQNTAVGNFYMFTARQYDPETGNYYYRARYYKPSIGRFLQSDPIGYEAGLNLYTYCGNNPVIFTDPHGLWQITIGGAYGFGGKITFGKNSGRWNIGGGFGYGLGAEFSFTPEDTGRPYASNGNSLTWGVEEYATAKLGAFEATMGLEAHAAIDDSTNVELRVGPYTQIGIPKTSASLGAEGKVVAAGNIKQAKYDTLEGQVNRRPVEFGGGGMFFAGATVNYSWDSKTNRNTGGNVSAGTNNKK